MLVRQLVHIDMAPNFAGTMMGITNCFANIVSIIAPLVAGLILQDEVSNYQLEMLLLLGQQYYCNHHHNYFNHLTLKT